MDNGDGCSLARVKSESVHNDGADYNDLSSFGDNNELDLELERDEQINTRHEEHDNDDDLEDDLEDNGDDDDLDVKSNVYNDEAEVDGEREEDEDYGSEPTVDHDDDHVDEVDDEIPIEVNNHHIDPNDPNVWILPKDRSACTLDEIRRGQTINKVALNECPVIGCCKKINKANPEASHGTISSGLKTHIIFVHYNCKKQSKKRKHYDSWNPINNSTQQSFAPTTDKRPMSSSSLYSVLAGLTQQQSTPLNRPNSSNSSTTNSLSHLKATLLDMKMKPSSGQMYDSYDGNSILNNSSTTNEKTISNDKIPVDRHSERNIFSDRYTQNDRIQNDEPDPAHALNAFIKIVCRRTGSNVGSAAIAEARRIIDKFTTSLISSSQTIADHYLTPPTSLYPSDIQQRPEVSPSDVVLAYKMLQKS